MFRAGVGHFEEGNGGEVVVVYATTKWMSGVVLAVGPMPPDQPVGVVGRAFR